VGQGSSCRLRCFGERYGVDSDLPKRPDLCRKDVWVLRPRVAGCAQQTDILKDYRPKFVQESTAFLGPGDSRKPIGGAVLNFG